MVIIHLYCATLCTEGHGRSTHYALVYAGWNARTVAEHLPREYRVEVLADCRDGYVFFFVEFAF